jgi:hypothetical protein
LVLLARLLKYREGAQCNQTKQQGHWVALINKSLGRRDEDKYKTIGAID